MISQPRGKLPKAADVWTVTIKNKNSANPKSTKQNLKIKPTDEAHWRIHLVMHSWLLSDVKHSLVSSVPGEAAQQVCHGAVPQVEASLLFLHPQPPLSQRWSCGSTENEGKVEGKSNANSYWRTFWLLLCTTFSKHVFEMVKRLEDGTAGAEEPAALYAQVLIAAEWLLNPSNLSSWPRNPSWAVGCCQTECAAFPSHLLKHRSSE